MRVKALYVTYSLLADMFTVGWKGDGVECVKGLPEGARLVQSYDMPEVGCAVLVFEHPDFEDVQPFELPPKLDVVHRKNYENVGVFPGEEFEHEPT